jgi:hypothetical protein
MVAAMHPLLNVALIAGARGQLGLISQCLAGYSVVIYLSACGQDLSNKFN